MSDIGIFCLPTYVPNAVWAPGPGGAPLQSNLRLLFILQAWLLYLHLEAWFSSDLLPLLATRLVSLIFMHWFLLGFNPSSDYN